MGSQHAASDRGCWAEDENLCEFEGQNTYHDEGISAGQS